MQQTHIAANNRALMSKLCYEELRVATLQGPRGQLPLATVTLAWGLAQGFTSQDQT